MTVHVVPYIHFGNNTREAMEYYNSILGGDLQLNTFGDVGLGDETIAGLIMHAQIDVAGSPVLMAADTPPGSQAASGNGLSVAVFGTDSATLRQWFAALARDGAADMPLEPAPWGDRYGQLTDRYGVLWLMNLSAADQ